MAKAFGYVAGRPSGLQVIEELEDVVLDEILPDENHPEVNSSILGDSFEPSATQEPVAEEVPAE